MPLPIAASTGWNVVKRKIRRLLSEPTAEVPTGHNVLHGVVRDASYLGVITQYEIEAKGLVRLTVYEQNVERATRSELWNRGEQVQVTWAPDHSFIVEDGAADA